MTAFRLGGRVLATFVWVACVAVTTMAQANEQPVPGPHLKVGDQAPRFGPMKLHNAELAGTESFTLAHFVGESATTPAKAVLVSFFATWCEPCKKTMPFLVEMNREYREKGLQVVLISIDKDEAAFKQVRALVQKHDFRFPVVNDRFNLLARRYMGKTTSLPSLFLLAADGSVAAVKQGYDEEVPASWTAAVRKLIGE